MKKEKEAEVGGFFKEFGEAVVKGRSVRKIILVWMGAGYIRRKQIIKGILIDSARSGSHCIHLWLCHRVCT